MLRWQPSTSAKTAAAAAANKALFVHSNTSSDKASTSKITAQTNKQEARGATHSFGDFVKHDVLRGKACEHGSMIVLGSGGHTAEMLWVLGSLPRDAPPEGVGLNSLAPRQYVVADTDRMSADKLADVDSEGTVVRVPRSREVGQSFVTSVWTTLVGFVWSFVAVWRACPSLVLCNGPGTCVPVLVAARLVAWLRWTVITTAYVESVARVERLSLSARIVAALHLADCFAVQWPSLLSCCPRGTLVRNFFFPEEPPSPQQEQPPAQQQEQN